jgi:Bacterial extracellular solute-binding proteins, family 5 Middle
LNEKYSFKLIVVFAVTFSLVSLGGPMSSNFHLPTVHLANANFQQCQTHGSSGACSEYWIPAGPSMNTEMALVFTDSTAEFNNLQSPTPSIDFTDSPLPLCLVGPNCSPFNFLISAPVAQVGYYEIEFHLANDFWGCQFNFGNSACGAQIRQGIAHMIDKTSFTNTDPNIATISAPIDNPLSTSSGGGLLSPNPCGYDLSFQQFGNQCIVGARGGTSYHLGNATGAIGVPWLQAPGSRDLNAAAQHFVNAGLAAGFNSTTSVLTGISSSATFNVPSFFIRNDDPPRLDLGNGLAEQICYLFTGSYVAPCPYLTIVRGPITSFPGLTTSKTSSILSWWMYTAAFSGPAFFDGSLFYTYNSRFVSGIPSIEPPCSADAVPTANAADYMYLCSSSYDNISSQMENAPCLNAPGDPAPGQTSNLPIPSTGGVCPGTSQLSAHSAGIQAEAMFGANTFTIPIYQRTAQYAYLNNGWIRAINSDNHGIPNYFTWLNAWNSNAALCTAQPCPGGTVPGTLRQGFSTTTRSINPFIATTVHDLYIVNNVYDSLYAPNPLAPSQILDWMTISTFQKDNASLGYPSGLQAPPHTLTSYRFTLRDDLYFQDGRPVTSYDVAFSYLSMLGQGSSLGIGATPMTGITVLGPRQFDIGVSSLGPFTLSNLASVPIVPGRYWTNTGSPSWDAATASCTSNAGCPNSQYTLSGPNVNCSSGCSPFSANLMTINPADTSAYFDPILNHIFVGSGAWQCGIVTSSGSGICTPIGQQNPSVNGGYTLTRFGKGLSPASSVSGIYFRSSGNAALWIWSGQNDVNPSTIFAEVAACYLRPVDITGSCYHFQQGIGGFNGLGGTPAPVNAAQVAIENRFYGLNWVGPFNWISNPPIGIAPFPPVLYEGDVTLYPCPAPNGYDC